MCIISIKMDNWSAIMLDCKIQNKRICCLSVLMAQVFRLVLTSDNEMRQRGHTLLTLPSHVGVRL